MLTRRTFLKALAAGAAGLVLPLDVAEALVAPARRLWALDGTMLGRTMAHDRDGRRTIFSDQRGGMGAYPWFDAGPPNVAKVPLWVEYTVYSDGTVVGPTTVTVINRPATR